MGCPGASQPNFGNLLDFHVDEVKLRGTKGTYHDSLEVR
jgi:hypothetical protein